MKSTFKTSKTLVTVGLLLALARWLLLLNPPFVRADEKQYHGILSFLDANPALRDRLLKWEKEAPPDVKEKISILRTPYEAVKKGYAAVNLGNEGKRAKGAILALIETLKDHTYLYWTPGGVPTSPADEAVWTLGKIGEPAVEPLIAAFKDEDSYVRWGAAQALGKIRDPRAVGPLIAALKDENSVVRAGAAGALGEIKDPRAVEPLIAAFKDEKDEYSSVRERAAKALEAITKKDFGQDQQKWRDWWKKQKM